MAFSCLLATVSLVMFAALIQHDVYVDAASLVAPTRCTSTTNTGYWCPSDADTVNYPTYYDCNFAKKVAKWRDCPSGSYCSSPGQFTGNPCAPLNDICDKRIGFWCATDSTHDSSYYYKCSVTPSPSWQKCATGTKCWTAGFYTSVPCTVSAPIVITTPACGDGICKDETCSSCAADCCPIYCGNGACDGTENCTTCPRDCCTSKCGDGYCNGNETCSSCREDCCPTFCGNAKCDSPIETCATCPADCCSSYCGDGYCNGNETCSSCQTDCCPIFCGNSKCDSNENSTTCPADCKNCGNGVCDSGENCTNCALDCCSVRCGNNKCDANETPDSCPGDCWISGCNTGTCKLPSCRCPDLAIPGNLPLADTPQFIVLTFDDDVSDTTWPLVKTIYDTSPLDVLKCPLKTTAYFYSSNTRWDLLEKITAMGGEAGSHSATHDTSTTTTTDEWKNQLIVSRDFISKFARQSKDTIQGCRAPFLYWNAALYEALTLEGFTFSSSVISEYEHTGGWPWPFTTHFGLPSLTHGCDYLALDSTVWEFPLYAPVNPATNSSIEPMDWIPLDTFSTAEILEIYKYSFDLHYKTNKAPWGVFWHLEYLYEHSDRAEMLGELFTWIHNNYANVFYATPSDVINWIKAPVTAAEFKSNGGFKCSGLSINVDDDGKCPDGTTAQWCPADPDCDQDNCYISSATCADQCLDPSYLYGDNVE